MEKIIHKYIDKSLIDEKQDEKISNILRVKNDCSFNASVESLLNLHKSIITEKEQQFFAWVLRTLPSHAWKTHFLLAYKIKDEIKKIFQIKRKSVWEILTWCIDTINVIHPFLDWNRRTIWKYTNMWLKWEWYKEIDWEIFRPFWEKYIYSNKTEFLNLMLKELENNIYIKK